MAQVAVKKNEQGLVKIDLQLPGSIRQEGEWFIATCPSLDIASQGRTEEEAKMNLEDALMFFFESCVERETVFQVLHKAGFAYDRAASELPPEEATDASFFSIHVPLPFVLHGQRDDHPTS
jgi:predicted RNase H-like HicB family nuclease